MEKIFKKSFLEGFASTDITIQSIILALVITLVISIYIFFVYRNITKKAFYSNNFNISLVGVSLITSAIIVTVQSSVVVSLGMVGALSIVRFRTAVKNPMDLMFLFWSISVGIICGAGYAVFAVVLSLVLTLAVLLLDRASTTRDSMILVINCTDNNIEEAIVAKIMEYNHHFTIKARNISQERFDLTVEIRTNEGGKMIKDIIGIDGVTNVSLIKHDGEITY